MYELIISLLPLVFSILVIIIPLLLSVAYLTLAERKIIGWMQLRQGPSVVGPFGSLQPIADALKLIFKEPIMPQKADKFLFLLAPFLTFVLAMIGWAVIPIDGEPLANLNVGVLYLLATSSLGVYGIIIAGWASNSYYAFLGSIRSAAQMISYELSISMSIACVLLLSQSTNLVTIVTNQHFLPWYIHLLLLPILVIFFISILAETNRHPFDLPEAESELVAGYHVEYSSMPFALFFLGEYANMILGSAMATVLFLGGWMPWFGISFIPSAIWFIVKIIMCLFIFIWVRAALPRYRYDQLMRLNWKVFLPFTLIYFVFLACIMKFCYFS